MSQYPELRLLIDGEWLSARGRPTQPVINPATGAVLGQLPHATKADLDAALEAAERAYPLWRNTAADERGRILRRAAQLIREHGETIARTATMEQGKPLAEARIEVQMVVDTLEWYAEECRRAYGRVLTQRGTGTRRLVIQEPVGPVAAFAPWNFPLCNPARKMGAALAAGCPCIMKPPEEAPASALAIAEALAEAGLPRGALSVVFGEPSTVSEHLIASPVIRKISFTGSTVVGKHLMKLAADGMKRTTMELGGHAPVLVFDDVDVEEVLDLTTMSKYRNAGQVCISPTRYYVHESIYSKFVKGFAARARNLPVGDGLVETNRMGPLAHERRIEAMERLIGDAEKHGGRVVAGGSRIGNHGYFWQPTVLADLPDSARIMNDEPFGPVAVMRSFSTFDEAMAQANRLPFGLAAYAFSRSARTTRLVGERIESGMVGINTHMIAFPDSPFVGVKESGHGAEMGIEGLETCLVTKFISEA